MTRLPLAFALLAAAGCAREPAPEPAPAPDALEVVRLVESLEAKAAVPAEVDSKLDKADRIVAAVDRSDPGRLSGAAERLLAR
jgi:hypothetical protein